MEKKCQGCKKTLSLINFKDSNGKKPDHIYSKCNKCRISLTKNNKNCSVCGINAVYNYEGQKSGIRCSKHKEPGMIDIKSKKCIKCKKKQPTFNNEGEKKTLYCNDCKEPAMIDIKSKKCIKCKKKQPNFNKEGEKEALYCSECKELDMIDIKNKKCIKCKVKHPTFNNEGEKEALYCNDCKEQNMINVKNKKCIKCKVKQPRFNNEGEKEALYCNDCKDPGMIDIKSKKCIKCKVKMPNFNNDGEKTGIYCGDCKEPDMIDVKNKKCIKCKVKIGIFNKKGEAMGIYCVDCKEPDMVDVKHKKCKEKGCRKRSYYAHPNVIPEYCATHRKAGMIQNPRKKCQGGDDSDCKEVAIYGLENGKPVHCEEHMLEDEYNLAERECVRCKRIDVLNKEGICVNFCSLEERDRLMKKRIKKDEEKIGNVLREEIDLPFIYRDEVVDKACSNKRPDFVYHCGTHIVIVEVDEDQHKSYKCTAYGDNKDGRMKGENIRMFEIAQSFDGLPVVFLRYNPDNYRVNGVLGKYSMSKRHDLLVKWIRKCIRDKDMIGYKVKYLFYDEFEESDGKFIEIKETDVL